MQRITISVDEELSETFDEMLRAKGYNSRSEGMRDLVRDAVERWREERRESRYCVGTLSYVYNRQTRSLAQRLSELQHDHHDLVAATTLVHLDHDHTLESVMLKGETQRVQAFADRLRAETGVKFGTLNLVGVEPDHEHARGHVDDRGHGAGHTHSHEGHAHLSPRPG
jgi:CopG family nickel-responsive transcriptional regulator